MPARVMVSGRWCAVEDLDVLNHPGHGSQKSHGRRGGIAKGRDLVKGGAAGLADDVVAGRAGFETSRDPALSVIAARQGFDGKPEVVSKAEMDALIRKGRPEMLRGVGGSQDGTKSAGEVNEEMRSGEARFGRGLDGNGYYFAPPRGSGFAGAENFADGTPGSLARATLHKDANVVKFAKLRQEHDAYFRSLGHEASATWETPRSNEDLVFGDIGRFAAAKGYDAIEMNDSKAGGYRPPQWVVVNRTALIVEEGP